MRQRQLPPLFDGGIPARVLWERQRRAEILRLFAREVYGETPAPETYHVSFALTGTEENAMEGRAVCKRVNAEIHGPLGSFRFPFVVFIPHGGGKHPALVFINNRDKSHTDPSRRVKSGFWPAEELVRRGFAAAAFHTQDVDTDRDDGFVNGVIRCFEQDLSSRPEHAWATIGAWAFGASRVLDFLRQQPEIDAERVGLVGHSRGGKAALWCAAQDTRFFSVYSSCSGCAGAAVTRGKAGEHVADITRAFPFWFCERYRAYAGREDAMAFDQHMLLALIAPRLLYVGSAAEDQWADPYSEFLSARLCGEAYALYGRMGLRAEEMPAPDTVLHGDGVGYHVRTGVHDLTLFDWGAYMDFWDSF